MAVQGTSKFGEVNIRITDKRLAKQIAKYCNVKKLGYSQFATNVFTEFFKDPRILLETKTKEELIEIIMTMQGVGECK